MKWLPANSRGPRTSPVMTHSSPTVVSFARSGRRSATIPGGSNCTAWAGRTASQAGAWTAGSPSPPAVCTPFSL